MIYFKHSMPKIHEYSGGYILFNIPRTKTWIIAKSKITYGADSYNTLHVGTYKHCREMWNTRYNLLHSRYVTTVNVHTDLKGTSSGQLPSSIEEMNDILGTIWGKNPVS